MPAILLLAFSPAAAIAANTASALVLTGCVSGCTGCVTCIISPSFLLILPFALAATAILFAPWLPVGWFGSVVVLAALAIGSIERHRTRALAGIAIAYLAPVVLAALVPVFAVAAVTSHGLWDRWAASASTPEFSLAGHVAGLMTWVFAAAGVIALLAFVGSYSGAPLLGTLSLSLVADSPSSEASP